MTSQSPKILIVDDEESMVFGIQDYLSSYAECLGATSYDEAVFMLEEDKDISLVISDIRMPDKDGFDLLMWLRENRPQVKVVMITAYGSPSVRSLAKRKGAVRYLEKPLDLEQLLQVVRQIAERKESSVAFLQDMGLVDVLQFLSFANKAVRVQVVNPEGEEGEIGLNGEQILWIRSGMEEGEEAFYKIMSWKDGNFKVLPLENETTLSVEAKLPFPLSFLLLEEARRRDEAAATTGEEKEEEERASIDLEHVAGIDLTKELVAWQTGIAGFVAATLTNMDGTYIAGTSNLPDQDLSEPAAYCAKAVKAIVETLNSIKTGHYREVLITTDTHYVIWRKLTDEIFLSLTVTIDQGNLGMARLQMDQLSKRVIEELR